MSAWGYRPEDNDEAWDIFWAARKTKDPSGSITQAFKGRLDSDEKWGRIGGLFLGLREGWEFKKAVISKAMDYLMSIEKDEVWLEDWKEPAKMAKSIKSTETILEGQFKGYRPFSRSLKENIPTAKPSVVGIGGF